MAIEVKNTQYTAIFLKDNEEAIIYLDGSIDTTTDNGRQVQAIGANGVGDNRVSVYGSVKGLNYGILLGDPDKNSKDTIDVYKTDLRNGTVTGGAYAMWLKDASTVTNAGVISGGLGGVVGEDTLHLTNSGLIEHTTDHGNRLEYAVHSAKKLTLTSSGTITGEVFGVYGSSDNDVITNNGHIKGASAAYLGAGDDFYDGRNGTVEGHLGFDQGHDTAYGGAGDERFYGQLGDDLIDGGAGNDLIDGGDESDTVRYSGSAAAVVSLSLEDYQDTGGYGTDKLVDIENLEGGSGNDRFTGSDVSNNLIGYGGNDTLDGGGDADWLEGGADNDTYYVDAGDQVVETAGGGTADHVYTSITHTLADYVENLTATGSGSITLNGNSQNNTIIGNAGKNRLAGGSGSDELDGGAETDIAVFSGATTDYMITKNQGGTFTVEDKRAGHDGKDTLKNIELAQFSDLFIDLNAPLPQPQQPNPQQPNPQQPGGGSQQPIPQQPGSFDKVLIGTKGKDALTGGVGHDQLWGRSGNDVLDGGVGQDVFAFDTKLGTHKTDRKKNLDKIVGFSAADDTIWLDNAIFKKIGKGDGLNPGKLKKTYFQVGKANDKNDYISYNKKTGYLSYDRDGSGDKYKAVEFAELDKNLTLTMDDFRII